jgi:hypothetical protein
MSESTQGNSAKYHWKFQLVRQAGNIISLNHSTIAFGENDRVGDANLYMQRWLLEYGVRRASKRLHIIYKEDTDKCLHDHPWAFTTLCVYGGYVEEIPAPDSTQAEALAGYPRRIEVEVRPWTIQHRPLDYKHRIVRLFKKKSITLLSAGPLTQHWGFHTNHGKEPWEEFVNKPRDVRVPWCDVRG